MVAPVFHKAQAKPFGYVANRAHHADIGGATPGSLPLATEIYAEGFRIPPVYLMRGGELNADVMTLFLANTRVQQERRGDLLAQLAALKIGEQRFGEMIDKQGLRMTKAAMEALRTYSARLMSEALGEIAPGSYHGEDWLDDDGRGAEAIAIRVELRMKKGRVVVDFSGTADEVSGGVNTNLAVTTSAVLYSLRLLTEEDLPANSGLLRPVEIVAPEGSVVNARFPCAVAGGNVETSQRIVDVVLKALSKALPDRIPAASCGSMNNLALGGYDAARERHFAYYETIAGGAGAGPSSDGTSAIHTHMTNTLNTPIEALEADLPLRVTKYQIRKGSGGQGRHRGGDGIVREMQAEENMTVTVFSERRRIPPYGLHHGSNAKTGENIVLRGKRSAKTRGKEVLSLSPGDRIRISTPGGGGWGRQKKKRGGHR